jgi:NitT/TauT family transport system permease protein
VLTRLPARVWGGVEERIYHRLSQTRECRVVQPIDDTPGKGGKLLPRLLADLCGSGRPLGPSQAYHLLHGTTWAEIRLLLLGAGATYLRVNAAIAHRRSLDHSCRRHHRVNPKLARFLQPITQVAASVPATASFPS